MSKVLNLKVVLLGDVGVGKTSIFVRLRDDRFVEGRNHEVIDMKKFDFEVNGTPVKIELWDTAGNEKHRTLTRNYYHGAKACIYIYDKTDMTSLYRLSEYQDDAHRFSPDHLCFLVGNKSDVEKAKQFDDETAKNFMTEKHYTQRFETSAKTGDGVKEAFQTIAEHLVKKHAPGFDPVTSDDVVRPSPLDRVGGSSKEGCC